MLVEYGTIISMIKKQDLLELPNLPKKIKRRESEIQLRVAEKLKLKHPHRNWILEVKTEKGIQKPHQKVAQKQIEKGTFLYKFADMGRQVPADYVFLGDSDYILCTETKVKNQITCEVNGGVIKYNFKI